MSWFLYNLFIIHDLIKKAITRYMYFCTVPVTSVTLTPVATTLIAGQLVNLTCITSYCDPPANITWYKSTTDIHVTSQSTYIMNMSDGLVRTTSSLQTQVVKMDVGKQVYCTASNIPGRSINSTVLTVDLWCMYTYLYMNYHT